MLRRIVRTAIVGLCAAIVAGSVLFLFFGLRVVLDGGGMPHLRFVESAEAQAERVERHREEQKASAIPPAPAPTSAGPVLSDGPVPSDVVGPVLSDRPAPPPSDRPRSNASAYWTDFRGPIRDGEYREGPLLTNWPADGLKPIWKQPVGGGYASFTIANNRAFTIEQRGPSEVVAAYDVATGRELWTNRWAAEFRETMGGDGPRATPTWSDGRVYALGAAGELRALDEAGGQVLWRTNILTENGASNLSWGMAASPLIVDGKVVVLPGGPNGRSVVAYDGRTGKVAWSALNDQQAYSAPMLVTLDGVRQLLVFSATRLMGLTVEAGNLLWEYSWVGPNGINAAQPLVIGSNRVFLSSGYGAGAAVIEVSKAANGFTVREIWRNARMKNRFASSVLYNGVIYGLDEAILAAIDAETGDLKWKAGRYGYGQVLLAHGHLIVLTEDGDLALVRARPERHEEVARFSVLSGKTWNLPAISGGYLLVRNLAEMAAFDLRVPR